MAQNNLLCQFCEISIEITWKCFNCDLVLCPKCAENHLKFSGPEQHCIIDLKQIGTLENVEIIRKVNLKIISCDCHEGEKCSLYCKDCKKPVCSFCVIEPEQKGHNLDKLVNVYNTQLSELKDMKKGIEKSLPELSNSVRESTTTSDNYNEIKHKIIQHEREIKEQVTKEAANLIHKLDKLILPSKTAFMEQKQKIQAREINLMEMNNRIDTALQSHKATSVLITIDNVNIHLPLEEKSDYVQMKQKFMFTVPDSLSINIGTIKRFPILKVINTFETNVPCFNNLKSLKDETLVCISVTDAGCFMGYINEQGDKYIIKNEIYISDKSGTFTDMTVTVTEDDKIMITEVHDGIRYKDTNNKHLNNFEIQNNPIKKEIVFRNGIHSFDQTILLGFEEYDLFANLKFQGTGVMILDKNGYCLKTLWNTEKDSDIHMLQGIDKLTTNNRGDIIIIDRHNLTLFDSKFKFKWTNQNPHKLGDLVTRPNGQIVVADIDSILVLSMEGNFLNSIGEEDGIHHPTCVHIDNSGQLLVGCKGENNENAKIHVVKILD